MEENKILCQLLIVDHSPNIKIALLLIFSLKHSELIGQVEYNYLIDYIK